MLKKLSILLFFLLTACVYRMDIQQGNILEQKDIDNLRPGLTKSQVEFVLGSPVISDSFSDDQWHYIYSMKSGALQATTQKTLKLIFVEDKLVSASGDFEIPEGLKN